MSDSYPAVKLMLTFFPQEVLVDVVDVVLQGSGIDEKFIGLTLFALVPNTTEFMNAMSFAMYGNIALRCVVHVFSLSLSKLSSIVWKLDLRTPFKSVYSKFLRW